jgi:prolyl-tRNA editing enzyme YbaK/EbsC (Cys-tRNA(Pro) deacylase)
VDASGSIAPTGLEQARRRSRRSVSSVIEHLVGRGAPFLVLSDPSSASIDETAASHGVQPDEIVRTEILVARTGPRLLVVPYRRAIDLELARKAVHDPTASIAGHAQIRAIASACEDVAGVPPLGSFLLAPVYVDAAVVELDQVVFPAGRVNVLVVMEREHLFAGDPYVVAPLTRESYVPEPAIVPSRRPVLADDDLRPAHVVETGDDRVS